MSVLDWHIFKSDAAGVVTLDTLTPMEAAASLVLDVATPLGDASGAHILLVPTNAGGLPHGFMAGRLRTLIRIQHANTGSSAHYYGVTAMMSQNNCSGVSGSCYMLSFFASGNSALRDLRLHKIPNGFSGGGITELGVYDITPTPDDGDTLPLELEWVADDVQLNGVLLNARIGAVGDTDYTSLDNASPVITYLDTVDPLLVTVNEGIAIRDGGICHFDLTSLYELVLS